ncbi:MULTISPECIES: MCE family protein [unclassified Pseudonocardia]|uniref:MCE family protein n=1 Tax=unclassified Pseudonocardia TaxID=2619320 RepID=UPI0009E66823|nr:MULTISPECIES: MCE family protein [unclassified Pseudonocardia]
MARTPRSVAIAMIAACSVSLSACGYSGLNDFTLPGVPGVGDGAYTVQIELRNVADLVPNNPVRVGDQPVGNITKVELDDWNALVTVSLNSDVELPANTQARIGQASLLGAKFVELTPPADQAPTGRLTDGARIGLEQSGKYPETEEVLASVATLLNGGNLQNLKTITGEVNKALGGRTEDFRGLITELETFSRGLDDQKQDITRAIDGIDRLAANFAEQDQAIDGALQAIPPALTVLNRERENLTDTLVSLGKFGDATDAVVAESSDNLARNLDNLTPALAGLADANNSLTDSLGLLGTIIFPLRNFGETFQGDYINFWLTLDLTLGTLDQNFLTGTPFEGQLNRLQDIMKAGGNALGAANPLTAPVLPEEPGAPVGEPGLDLLDGAVPNEPPPGPPSGTLERPAPPEQSEFERQQEQQQQQRPAEEPSGGGLLDGLTGGN